MRHIGRANLQPYVWVSPAVLIVSGMLLYPVIYLLVLSLRSSFFFEPGRFSGFENFRVLLFLRDGLQTLRISLLFTVFSVLGSVALGMASAIALDAPLRAAGFLRTLILLPWILSHVVVALAWQSLLSSAAGLVPELCSRFFGRPCEILSRPSGALASIVLANIWHSYPYAFLVLLAGLHAIPDEIYEAAEIDGASTSVKFWKFTVPLSGSHILACATLLSIQYMGLVTIPFVLTGGGPYGATTVLALHVWREAFSFYRLGVSSAAAVLLTVSVLGLTLIYIRFFLVGEAD